MVASLEIRTDGNVEFHQIVDFLTTSPIHYALIVSPTIYASYIEQFLATAKSKTVNNVKQIHATVDGKTMIALAEPFNDVYVTPCIITIKDDRVVKDATTATSLEVEQESVNTSRSREDSVEHQDDLKNFVAPTPHDSPLSGGLSAFGTLKETALRLGDQKALKKSQKIRKDGKGQVETHESRSMFEEGDFDDDFDDIDDMVNEAMENVEGDTVNVGGAVNTATTGVSAASASVTTCGVSINEKSRRLQGKGVVAISDVEESARSTTILPTIDPKDKGKGIMQEPKASNETYKRLRFIGMHKIAPKIVEEEQATVSR
ncbi:hypothetical protein Tco_0497733 [Tanacetum coccineum]